MSDGFWNITLRLGSWSGQVKMPKSKFPTAQDAINQAMQDIIIANANREVGLAKRKQAPCWATKGEEREVSQ